MNTTQIQALRQMHVEVMGSVLRRPAMTAREMALTPHNLSKAGDMATLSNGSRYVWDNRLGQWAPWK